MTDEREQAQHEAADAQHEASAARVRPRVVVDGADITEDVVTVLEALWGSLDWGSGFLTDEEETAAIRLMELMRFESIPRPTKMEDRQPHPYEPPPPTRCGLCGHVLDDGSHGYAAVGYVRLCHAKDHSCYELWVQGARPEEER